MEVITCDLYLIPSVTDFEVAELVYCYGIEPPLTVHDVALGFRNRCVV